MSIVDVQSDAGNKERKKEKKKNHHRKSSAKNMESCKWPVKSLVSLTIYWPLILAPKG
jgi:hypothetical protein